MITAAFFTLQHMPLFFANGTSLAVVLPLFFLMAVGFRALIGWCYNLVTARCSRARLARREGPGRLQRRFPRLRRPSARAAG